MENLKDKLLFILALGILVLLCFTSLKQCNNPKIHSSTDTITVIKHSVDTIRVPVSKIVYKDKYKPVYITVDKYGDTTNIYKDTTVLKQEGAAISIIRQDSVKGVLLGSKTSILGSFPKIIDSVKVTTTITKRDTIAIPPRFSLSGGFEAGGNKSSVSSLSPFILVNIKNKSYIYKYNILDNTHDVGIAIKLFSKQ